MNPGGRAPNLLLCALLVACGSEQKPDAVPAVVHETPPPDTTTPIIAAESLPPPPPEDTSLRVFVAAGRQWGTTEREIRRRLGGPDRVIAEPFPNQHDSTKTDTIVRLVYRDLTVVLYRVTESGSDLLLQAVLSRSGRPLPLGIDVGTRKAEVVEILGSTREGLDEDENETLEYRGGPMESPGVVRFVLRRDRVQRIEWVYFID